MHGGSTTDAEANGDDTIGSHQAYDMIVSGNGIPHESRRSCAPLARAITAIVKYDHVAARRVGVQIGSKRFSIPGIAAETQEQG